MKIKTSITISKDLIKEIDSVISKSGNRSLFIEEAVIDYLKHRKRLTRDQKDFEIINNHSDELNNEAADILTYQAKF